MSGIWNDRKEKKVQDVEQMHVGVFLVPPPVCTASQLVSQRNRFGAGQKNQRHHLDKLVIERVIVNLLQSVHFSIPTNNVVAKLKKTVSAASYLQSAQMTKEPRFSRKPVVS
mgnify:CR=1 FL=1